MALSQSEADILVDEKFISDLINAGLLVAPTECTVVCTTRRINLGIQIYILTSFRTEVHC